MYPDYVLVSTGRMLEPEPGGGPYDIRVAPGRNPTLPLPPGDGRWHPVSGEDEEIAVTHWDASELRLNPELQPVHAPVLPAQETQ